MRGLVVVPVLLLGCAPPSSGGRAVVELYMHPNGLSNCVDENNGKWTADPSCCPAGFDVAGFSAPAVTEYAAGEDGKKNRRIYRHVVCIQSDGKPAK